MPRRKSDGPSIRKILSMPPEELKQVDPVYFHYMRAKDIAKFTDDQLFSLTPDQIKALKPIQFSHVHPNKLRHLLALLERQVPDEQDVFLVEEPDRSGETRKVERYGAKETIRRAIPKAEARIEMEQKRDQLRRTDGFITPDEIDAKVVAAKLNISMRYLDILAKKGEIRLYRTVGRHLCDAQSVIDYLNRQRVPGAQLDENGKPIMDGDHYVPVELEPLTEIPVLYPVEHFAERLGMESRSFIRNCNAGYYDHFRIGQELKMSEEDFQRSVKRQIAAFQNREKSVGRPANVLKM